MDKGNDLNGVVQTIKELEDSRNQFMCENHQLAETMTELENDVDELENIHREDIAHIDELETNIATLTRDNKQLHCAIQSKDLEIAELRSVARDVDDLRRENEAILKDLHYTESMTAQVRDAVAKLEESIEEKKHTIGRQENQIARIQQKIGEFRKTMDSLTEENECILRRNEECRKCVEDAAAENERLLEKIRQLDSTRIKMEECNKKNVLHIKHLKMELAKEVGVGSKMTNKINALEDENNKTKRELLGLREEIGALNEELDEEQAEIDKVRSELKRKIQEFETYKNTITSLKDKIMNNRNNTPLCNTDMNNRSTTRRHRFQSQPPPAYDCNAEIERDNYRQKTAPCTKEKASKNMDTCRSRNATSECPSSAPQPRKRRSENKRESKQHA